MTTPLITIAAILALGTLFVLIPVASDSYRRFRRRRVVTCPETKASAEILIDARHAACSSLFGNLRLRVKGCTRWPKREDCAQDCLPRL
jgi:hypothetical protein